MMHRCRMIVLVKVVGRVVIVATKSPGPMMRRCWRSKMRQGMRVMMRDFVLLWMSRLMELACCNFYSELVFIITR